MTKASHLTQLVCVERVGKALLFSSLLCSHARINRKKNIIICNYTFVQRALPFTVFLSFYERRMEGTLLAALAPLGLEPAGVILLLNLSGPILQ